MRYILILAGISLGLWAYTQEDDTEFQTIFGSDFSSGGYGAPELKLGKVNNEMSLLLGGKGGWIIGHKFVLGGGGYGLTTNNTFNYTENIEGIDSTRNLKIDMGYGGILLEYIAMPKKAVHLAFPVLIGAGGAALSVKTYDKVNNVNPEDWTVYDLVESSAFFVVEPGVNIELNMVKFFRLNLGASYRYISGIDLQRLDKNALSDFSFNLGLKFGKF
jgi:hypothetical protein